MTYVGTRDQWKNQTQTKLQQVLEEPTEMSCLICLSWVGFSTIKYQGINIYLFKTDMHSDELKKLKLQVILVS